MIELLKQLESPPAVQQSACTLPIRGRLLYAVNHSYPFSSNGYAVRTHGVASALVRAGVEVIAISRPGSPWDRPGFNDAGFALEHRIDGVHYVHLPDPRQAGMALPEYTLQASYAFAEVLRVFRPQAVMAASNWHNALPAAMAAQTVGLPFFYEVRGFWEISQASRDSGWGDTPGFAEAVAGETAIARAAECVFTLNRHMREELMRRGVADECIDLVPNGFIDMHHAEDKRLQRHDLGVRSQFLVGYVGSFNSYEGLEDLITAVALLRGRGVDVTLMLVGSSTRAGGVAVNDCPVIRAYRELASRLGIVDYVYLPGRVSPENVSIYYDLMDVVVIPRRPDAVSELVSPLKPLEAAALGKRVLMSDVAPLVDLGSLCPNFSYFTKGDIDSLAERLGDLLAAGDFSPIRCDSLGSMSWAHNIEPILAAINATRSSGCGLSQSSRNG